MAEKNVRVALREVLEELTGKPPRLSCALENSGEWSRCDLIFESSRIGYRNPQGGASAGSTVWHSWLTTPAAHAPLIAYGAVVSVEVAPAHTITPAEAVESLYAREAPLWPWSPGDDAAPRWWCEACEGNGSVEGRGVPCGACGATMRLDDLGSTTDPSSLATLVTVASLGAPTLRAAEELARVIVGRTPRIVWRVMPKDAFAAIVKWVNSEQCAGSSPRASHDLVALGVVAVAIYDDQITLAVAAI